MAAETLSNLIARVRLEVRDTGSPPIFTDDEVAACIADAICAYSSYVPREVSAELPLIAGTAEYTLPDDCLQIVSVRVGGAGYQVKQVFGNTFTINPMPAGNRLATIRYRACHIIPGDTAESSTYSSMDEPLIVTYAKARCLEMLAHDAARCYRYIEGDIEEYPGDPQAQLRAEADALYAQFNSGALRAQAAFIERKPIACTPSVGVVTRKAPEIGGSIFTHEH